MYYDDHGPAHFHAYYGSDMAVFRIDTLEILSGDLPNRAQNLVREWGLVHRAELTENWRRISAHEPLTKIEPLE